MAAEVVEVRIPVSHVIRRLDIRGGYQLVRAFGNEVLDPFAGRFQMELQPDNPVIDGECLIRAGLAFNCPESARRDCEGVAMPVKPVEFAGQRAEYRRFRGIGSETDRVPADLRFTVAGDRAAEDVGDQLCAETDAENYLAVVGSLADEPLLVHQPGVAVVLVNVHESAENDQPVEIRLIGQGVAVKEGGPRESMTAHVHPVAYARRILERQVLQEMNPHGASILSCRGVVFRWHDDIPAYSRTAS